MRKKYFPRKCGGETGSFLLVVSRSLVGLVGEREAEREEGAREGGRKKENDALATKRESPYWRQNGFRVNRPVPIKNTALLAGGGGLRRVGGGGTGGG